MMRRIGGGGRLALGLVVMASFGSAIGQVVEHASDQAGWLAAAPGSEDFAFDSFFTEIDGIGDLSRPVAVDSEYNFDDQAGTADIDFRIADPDPGDCNGNGIPDVDELDGNDCNSNGILDSCEIGDEVTLASWWSNRTASQDVSTTTSGGTYRMRLSYPATSGFVEGVVALPAGGYWRVNYSYLAAPDGSTSDFIDVYMNGAFVERLLNTQDGVREAFAFVSGSVLTYRFEWSVQSPTPPSMAVILSGDITRREEDCNSNGIPEECESFDDCNTNGVPDTCDIVGATGADINGNGVLDACELAQMVPLSQTRFVGGEDPVISADDFGPFLAHIGDGTWFEVGFGYQDSIITGTALTMLLDATTFYQDTAPLAEDLAADPPTGPVALGFVPYVRSVFEYTFEVSVPFDYHLNGTLKACGGSGPPSAMLHLTDGNGDTVLSLSAPAISCTDDPLVVAETGSLPPGTYTFRVAVDSEYSGVLRVGRADIEFRIADTEISDCNDNGIADEDELDGNDCDSNGVLDSCEGLLDCDPPSGAACPACDVYCDGIVNGVDIAWITSSANYGLDACAALNRRADVDRNGFVNGLDVAVCTSSACFGL